MEIILNILGLIFLLFFIPCALFCLAAATIGIFMFVCMVSAVEFISERI